MHAIPGMCTLNIFDCEISLSCGKFRKHHREPLFGHGNTFGRGLPVVETVQGGGGGGFQPPSKAGQDCRKFVGTVA